MHILTFTTLFPSSQQPVHGLFVRNRMEAFVRKYGHRWTVVAPVPYFPRLPFKVSAAYDAFARVPAFEKDRGYPVYHPRYLVTPVIGMRYYGGWMAKGASRIVREIHARDPVDVIDAHYVYPDGTAASSLGRALNVPVILSARGTDLNVFTKMPDIEPLIRMNLRDAARVICVSGALAKIAGAHGADSSTLEVIGNGIDPELFHPLPASECRNTLGIPAGKRVVISVGHLVELKGFHLLLEAVAAMGREDVVLVIVGEGPERGRLEAMASQLGIQDRFFLPGAVAQNQLPKWYAAADLFVLMSSREGWPNVVCEAQAMGLPVIATRVGGVEELIEDASQGTLLVERSAKALLPALTAALEKEWDRDSIAARGRARTWEAVADRLQILFSSSSR